MGLLAKVEAEVDVVQAPALSLDKVHWVRVFALGNREKVWNVSRDRDGSGPGGL